MAKLTKPQAAIIAGSDIGGQLFSDPLTNTQQRSIDALVKHDHLKITGRVGRAMIEYTIQDTPEVRAAIMADASAAAQPATVNAEAEPRMCDCGNARVIPGTELCEDCRWAGQMYPHLFPEDHAPTASADAVTVEQRVRETHDRLMAEIDEQFEPDGAGIDFGLQNQVDTLKFDLKIADDHITEQTEQIAALTRDLEAARASASALRVALDGIKPLGASYATLYKEVMAAKAAVQFSTAANGRTPKYHLNQQVMITNDPEQIGTVEEIRVTNERIEYSVYVDGESMPYTWNEESLSAAPDNGQRVSAWTPSIGDRVEVPCYNGNYPLDDPIRFGMVVWVSEGVVGVRNEAYHATVEEFEISELKHAD